MRNRLAEERRAVERRNIRFAPKAVGHDWLRSGRIRRNNTALAIERRGERVGGGTVMLVLSAKTFHDLGIRDCS